MLECTRNAIAATIAVIWFGLCADVLITTEKPPVLCGPCQQCSCTSESAADDTTGKDAHSMLANGVEARTNANPPSGNNTRQRGENSVMNDKFFGLTTTGWMFIQTIAIFIVGMVQACIYGLMWRNSKIVESAYVSLDDLEVEQSIAGLDHFIVVTLRNSGKTPARIIDANISVRIQIADGEPPTYDAPWQEGNVRPPAIIVAGETTRWRHQAHLLDADVWNMLAIQPGAIGFFTIYGYIHYADDINPNVIREYGWGRTYDRVLSLRRRQILFAHINAPGYNYARERKA